LTAAEVFCRSLGSRYGVVSWTNAGSLPYSRSIDFSDGLKKPILMDDVSCSGNENSFYQCSYKSKSNCNHNEDVIVTCSTHTNFTSNVDYRMANPRNITNSSGYILGIWGRAEYFNYTS